MLRDLALIFLGFLGGAAITHVLHLLRRDEAPGAKPKVGGGPGEGGEGP